MRESWRIIKEDKHTIIVCKPAGLVVQGAKRRAESLLYQVKDFLKVRNKKPGNVFLAVVHRLDKPVSGAVVFAKRSKSASRLFQAIANGALVKVYLAVVEGMMEGKGLWVDFLRWCEGDRRVKASDEFLPEAKRALTYYQVLSSNSRQSILLLSPITGRKHQLRVALSKRGHPVVGDCLYGSQEKLPNYILLHCLYLLFPHPVADITEEVLCLPPPYFPPLPLDKATILEFLNDLRKAQVEGLVHVPGKDLVKSQRGRKGVD